MAAGGYPCAMATLEERIEEIWETREELDPYDRFARETIEEAIRALDEGAYRVAEVDESSGEVVVNIWLKHAILLWFKSNVIEVTRAGPFEWADKLPLKEGFKELGVRAVPGSSVRWGAHLEPGVILMPSYVNIGAWVGRDTMVDTWATVGSCAQIGERVHLAGGVGIGGVLEPPQAAPVVVGDDAMIGSRSMVTQGARVGQGAVLGEGSLLNPSIPVIDAATGQELGRGVVPPWCVAIPAQRKRQFPGGEFFLPCMLVIRRLQEGERHDKALIEQILREQAPNP